MPFNAFTVCFLNLFHIWKFHNISFLHFWWAPRKTSGSTSNASFSSRLASYIQTWLCLVFRKQASILLQIFSFGILVQNSLVGAEGYINHIKKTKNCSVMVPQNQFMNFNSTRSSTVGLQVTNTTIPKAGKPFVNLYFPHRSVAVSCLKRENSSGHRFQLQKTRSHGSAFFVCFNSCKNRRTTDNYCKIKAHHVAVQLHSTTSIDKLMPKFESSNF